MRDEAVELQDAGHIPPSEPFNPVVPESELARLLQAQDLRVGMTLKEYEVPRG